MLSWVKESAGESTPDTTTLKGVRSSYRERYSGTVGSMTSR